MTTYTWVIEQMNCYPTAQGQADVVFNVVWRCNGTDDTYSGTNYGTCGVEFTGGVYTPYNQLTKDQVLGWIWANGVDKAAIEASIDAQIERQINPPVVNLPIPWSE